MTPQQKNDLRDLKEALKMLAGVLFASAVILLPVWAIMLGV